LSIWYFIFSRSSVRFNKMKPVRIHSWNVSPSEAFAIQMNLRDKITIQPLPDKIHLVAGTNVSHDPNTNTIHAALVVLRFPDMELVERHGLSEEITFPYVRGILAFREAPPIMKLMKRVQHSPDVVLFHSHGLGSSTAVWLSQPSRCFIWCPFDWYFGSYFGGASRWYGLRKGAPCASDP